MNDQGTQAGEESTENEWGKNFFGCKNCAVRERNWFLETEYVLISVMREDSQNIKVRERINSCKVVDLIKAQLQECLPQN